MDFITETPRDKRYGFLRDFLYDSIFVPEGSPKPPKDIVDRPELQVYIKDFGEEADDYCLAAYKDGEIIGAVWARIMDDYGHIDDETPSLAISVKEQYRGKGVGTSLMENMLRLLGERGYKQTSLSVQKANRALKMYEKLGFEVFRDKDEEYIMVKKL